MVANRRFGPLIFLVAFGVLVLTARLYQVQVVEHEVWAREAANLVRSATTVPYLRGPITDRDGEVFVQDIEACAIQFVYRDFRRRHPLGQVTHARSALEHTSVPLQQGAQNLEAWAMALLESTPRQLEAFEAGEAVQLAGLAFPEVGEGKERRRSRAGDLRFYVHGLLDVRDSQWRAIKKRLKQDDPKDSTWLELAAAAQEVSVERKRAELARRFDTSLGRLQQLAAELEVSGPEGELAVSASQSFWFLVDALERKRESVEDAIVVDLFRAAAGFHPGRVEPELLLTRFDLDWMSATLGWDEPRLERWALSTRETWLSNWRTFHVPAALIRVELDRENGADSLQALVGELSLLFTPRPSTERERRAQNRSWSAWAARDEVAVFRDLPDLFEGVARGARSGAASVPFVDEALRRELVPGAGPRPELLPFEFAEAVAVQRPLPTRIDWRGEEQRPWRAPADFEEAQRRLEQLLAWRARSTPGASGELVRPEYLDDEELLPWVAELWQAQFQARLRDALDELRWEGSGAPPSWPLPFAAWRLKNARQAADYAIRDRSNRPEILHEDPDESVVNLLLRFRADYGGFSILPRTRRLAMALDVDGDFVARPLIGEVRESTLREVIEQQNERSSLSNIMHQRVRTAEDRAAVEQLVAQIYRNDELHGTSGIEGLCDSALRGVNGFVEDIGLQEREDSARASLYKQKLDGHAVQLTLDLELQKAAQETIEHPKLPSGESWRDEVWFRNPVGAIVLATVDGEILAAASGPKQPHELEEALSVRDGERQYAYDRCFRRPRFQPVGSIFKPFVAAYALDRLGLTPTAVLPCEVREGFGSAGWGKVSCNSRWGHHDIALVAALEQSCNAYFAQVGELYGERAPFLEMAHMFGFDRPTGVRDAWDGRGFVEDTRIPRFVSDREFLTQELHKGCNGLELLEATPVQVARAAAGLATGRLPAMRLVRSIGGELVPASYEEVPISEASLEVVRGAMRGVIAQGSASGKGLESELLGFDLAGKTGSADYLPMSNAYRAQLNTPSGRTPEMRKHTWFMGYFPAEAPRFVIVAYLHDIGVTSSHSAVYVAGQFLKSPAVQDLVRESAR